MDFCSQSISSLFRAWPPYSFHSCANKIRTELETACFYLFVYLFIVDCVLNQGQDFKNRYAQQQGYICAHTQYACKCPVCNMQIRSLCIHDLCMACNRSHVCPITMRISHICSMNKVQTHACNCICPTSNIQLFLYLHSFSMNKFSYIQVHPPVYPVALKWKDCRHKMLSSHHLICNGCKTAEHGDCAFLHL